MGPWMDDGISEYRFWLMIRIFSSMKQMSTRTHTFYGPSFTRMTSVSHRCVVPHLSSLTFILFEDK